MSNQHESGLLDSSSSDTGFNPYSFAGWSALIFALVFPTILTLAYFVVLPGYDAPQGLTQAVYSTGKLIQFVFPVALIVWFLKQKLLWAKPSKAGIAIGLGFGAIVFAAMMLLFFLVFKPHGLFDEPAEAISEKMSQLGFNGPVVFLMVGVFYSLCHSFLEEYYWRWFVHAQLRKRLSFGIATLISSAGFMAHHVILLAVYFGWDSPWTYVFSLAVAIGGAFWAWLYETSKSLYGPWLSHLVIDAAIFTIGYQLLFS